MKTAVEQYDSLETDICKKNYFRACVQLMDDDMCMVLYNALAVEKAGAKEERAFLVVYSIFHEQKFGEEFCVD